MSTTNRQRRCRVACVQPAHLRPAEFDAETRRLLRATIDWFEAKGKERLLSG